MKPQFLLDEHLQPTLKEIKNSQFISLRQLTHPGTPDWLLLEKTKEENLTIVTNDKGLVLRALCENQDVIYEDQQGNRFFFHGKNNYLLSESEGVKIDWKYNKKIRKAEKLAKMRTNNLSLSGLGTPFCI